MPAPAVLGVRDHEHILAEGDGVGMDMDVGGSIREVLSKNAVAAMVRVLAGSSWLGEWCR